MRQLLLVSGLVIGLIGLSGCAQTRRVCQQGKCHASSAYAQGKRGVSNAYTQGKRQVNHLAGRFQRRPVSQPCATPAARCAPPARACDPRPECICWNEPIYPNHCGGDNGIGRGGTGAFRIP